MNEAEIKTKQLLYGVKVGKQTPKVVTPENAELFNKARKIMDDNTCLGKPTWHMGWYEVGLLVDYIELTYGLKKLEDKQ